MASETLQYQSYSAAVDHVCKQTTMLHEVTDSEEELEDELVEKFHDCFEDEDEVIANVDNHGKFRDDDFV